MERKLFFWRAPARRDAKLECPMSRKNAPELKLYAGCWVALVRGRVVAAGGSAQETLLHCRAMRLKDEPLLRYVPQRRKTARVPPKKFSRHGNV